jgi:ABC-type arginine transport system permease subunit
MYLAVEEWLLHNSTKCITNIFLILVMQSTLVALLLVDSIFKEQEMISMPTAVDLVICRIICTVFLHLILAKEL